MGCFKFSPGGMSSHELDTLLELAGRLAGQRSRTPIRRFWLGLVFAAAVEKALRAVEDEPALAEVALELPDLEPRERVVLTAAAAVGTKFEDTAPALGRFFEALAKALAGQGLDRGPGPGGGKAPGVKAGA